jgi:hypothetical protein
MANREVIKTGVSFGSVLAMIISYVTWNSILWAIFHGLLGWIYVVYYILVYKINVVVQLALLF